MSTHRSEPSAPSRPFQEFFTTEAASGALLFACAAAALAVGNSPWADGYHRLWTARVTIGFEAHALDLSVHDWVNDGLMAVFFLLVGLEIKREVIAGELATMKQAALPIAGALGGMIVPAGIYLALTDGGAEARGWAIPMATDIAFALGALALVAPRAPAALKVFLAALAIVDDLGAVAVIAIFYSGGLAWDALGLAAVVVVLLVTLNRLSIRAVTPYLVLGVVLWYFMHESGVHATLAGVLLAFTIPATARINAEDFSHRARRLLDDFDRTETGDLLVLTSKGQQDAIIELERASERVTPPLLRLEHALHAVSAFAVMPLFALSNAGVSVDGVNHMNLTVAVMLSLALGKALGITAAAAVAVRWGLAALPAGVTWTALHGCAWLGGIGFTMSLFIATLAFQGTSLLDSSKIGILAGSLAAGVIGAIVLRAGISAGDRTDSRF